MQWDEPSSAGARPPRQQPASPSGHEAAPLRQGRESEAARGSRQADTAAGGYPDPRGARQVRYAQQQLRHDATQDSSDCQPSSREHFSSKGGSAFSGGACNGSGSRRLSQVSSMSASDPGFARAAAAAGSANTKAPGKYGAGCDANSVIRVSQEARAQRERAQARNRGGGIFGEDAPMSAERPPQYGGGGGSSAASTPKALAAAPHRSRGIFAEDAPLPAPPPRHGGNLW